MRRYEPQDAQRCCEVINTAVVHMDGLNQAARAHIRNNNIAERLGPELERWFTFVVEANDEVVGVGALDHEEIKRIYVDPRAQGQGIATSLVTALEAAAKTQRIETVHLDASPSSVSFYESLGYSRARNDQLRVGDALFTFVHMTKHLSPQPRQT